MAKQQPVRAITIRQPYATLIAIGAKHFETRTWGVSHSGPLLIHAAKRWDLDRSKDCARVMGVLGRLGFSSYSPLGQVPWGDTLGCVLAVANLVDCVQTQWLSRIGKTGLTEMEEEFGNFAPWRMAWRIDDARPLTSPVACRGRQGLWTPDSRLLDLIEKARDE